VTDSPDPSRPGSQDLVALVQRALAERVDPISARLRAIESSLARLGEASEIQADDLRANLATAVQQAVAQIDHARAAESTLLLGRITALEVPLQRDAEDRRSSGRLLRESVVTTVAEALAHAEANRATDAARVLEHVDALRTDAQARQAEAEDLRRTVSSAIEQGVLWLEAAVTTDTGRVLERITALEEPLLGEAASRRDEADGLRHTLEQAVAHLIREAKARGEIAPSLDEQQAVDALLCTRTGIMLGAKAGLSPERLREVADFTIERLTAR